MCIVINCRKSHLCIFFSSNLQLCQKCDQLTRTRGSSIFCLINNNVQYHRYVFTLCSSRGQSSWRRGYRRFSSRPPPQRHSSICRGCTLRPPDKNTHDHGQRLQMSKVIICQLLRLKTCYQPWKQMSFEIWCPIWSIKVRGTNLFVDFSSLTWKVGPAVAARIASFLQLLLASAQYLIHEGQIRKGTKVGLIITQ